MFEGVSTQKAAPSTSKSNLAGRAILVVALALAGGAAVLSLKPGIGRTATRDLGNPRQNRAPSAATTKACNGTLTQVKPGDFKITVNYALCDGSVLADINAAHKAEGIPPMVLPAGYERLNSVKQLVWAVNAERTVRGLPSMPENTAYDALASKAITGTGAYDPVGPPGYADWGIAASSFTPLYAVFNWMYHDGVDSFNLDCMPGNMGGCWGHRDGILVNCRGEMGAGAHRLFFTGLFVCLPKGSEPKGPVSH